MKLKLVFSRDNCTIVNGHLMHGVCVTVCLCTGSNSKDETERRKRHK